MQLTSVGTPFSARPKYNAPAVNCTICSDVRHFKWHILPSILTLAPEFYRLWKSHQKGLKWHTEKDPDLIWLHGHNSTVSTSVARKQRKWYLGHWPRTRLYHLQQFVHGLIVINSFIVFGLNHLQWYDLAYARFLVCLFDPAFWDRQNSINGLYLSFKRPTTTY